MRSQMKVLEIFQYNLLNYQFVELNLERFSFWILAKNLVKSLS